MDASQIIHEITEIAIRLSAIPHLSGQEQAISRHLADRLRSWGMSVDVDSHWNLRCDLPATAGFASAPLVCIQGHLDMARVALQNNIHCQVRNNWLESPLETDHLPAIAAVLWLLKQPFPHGPVRLLLTTGGERAMTGAKAIDPCWLDGVRYLIGTDGFHLEQLTVGSSGGCYQAWSRTIETTPTDMTSWNVTLTDFPGGHSALDFGKGRVNPLRLLGTLLMESDAEIVSFSGGSAEDVIPSDASAVIIPKNPDIFALWQALTQELGGQLAFSPSTAPVAIWSPIDRQAALDFLLSLPNGITAHLPEQPELPACSSNLGRVDYVGNLLTYHVLLRGTPQQALDRAANGCALLADRCGFDLTGAASYPVWLGDQSNPLAQRMSRLWETRNGTPMRIGTVHTGSELSVFTQLSPALTAVSTGITIENPHSIRTRTKLTDLPAFVRLLQDTLEEIAQKG